MSIKKLANKAIDKSNFTDIQGYIDFCQAYLDFVGEKGNLQAVIVSRNEKHYRFWQYDEQGDYQITRPINSELMYGAAEFEAVRKTFLTTLESLKETKPDPAVRASLNNTIYTIQQSIGAALDALPAGDSNKARKINGTLFENLIKFLLKQTGVDVKSGDILVPVVVDGQEQFKTKYQHDLIVSYEGEIKAIGSVKTTSKDRLDKVFIDKFLYSKLTQTSLPHIAIFLNDVQRAGKAPKYGISGTFLPGHFKAYTVKLNPLDGVYYCDIRPNMRTEPILKDHIRTIDHLFCDDIWSFVRHHNALDIKVEEETKG